MKDTKPKVIPPAESPAPPDAPATMKVWDDYGRVMEISREDWRKQILPSNFERVWDKPDDLAALINSALNDGFIADALEPARQLHRIDTNPQRGALFLAVIFLQLKEFAQAEKLLLETMQKHGEDGVLLTNLAKAQNGRGEAALAERTLWHALELDPNQDNGFMWYAAIQRDRGGEEAGSDALQRIAALPRSWRALLWQGKAALEARKLEEALVLYQNAIKKAGAPVPSDLLMHISGDLGNQGHLPEILQLVGPHFDPAIHGVLVGNNLIKAHFDLGQFDFARRLLDKLFALNRGDWKEHLQFWDSQLAQAQVELSNTENVSPTYSMLTIEGPVWLKPSSPTAELFPAKTSDTTRICLIGSSVEVATNSKRPHFQMSDTPGRFSRALPLFLAEQLELRCEATVQTLVPWLAGPTPGFALMGGVWEDGDVATYARQTQAKSDYVISIGIKAVAEPWQIELRLIRTIDGKRLGSFQAPFTPATMQADTQAIIQQLFGLLKDQLAIEPVAEHSSYELPVDNRLPDYLLRLEQLLVVRCAAMDGMPGGFLHGEREIMDGNLQLCLDHPKNVTTRILLVQTFITLIRARPEMIAEYKDKVARLQREHPLPEPAQGVLQRILDDAAKDKPGASS